MMKQKHSSQIDAKYPRNFELSTLIRIFAASNR